MKNEVILCFGYSSWEFWRQDHEIMLELAKKNRVIYVEKQLCFSEFRIKNISIWKNIIRNMKPVQVSNNLFIISAIPKLPIGILLYFKKAQNNYVPKLIIWSKNILKFYVKILLQRLGLKPTVVWCFEPFELPLMGQFGEKIDCYRVFDEVSLFEGWLPLREIVENFEKRYITKAHFVFASSRFQYEKRKSLNSNTFFIPNACNFERYHKVLTNNISIPDDIKNILRPIIGFIGKIDSRLDIKLIKLLSASHPEWSIVFIGWDNKLIIEGIKTAKCRNVHFLGKKEVVLLPNYLKAFNVSIIPYILSESTRTMYPWKMHEHLAAGKPVVSTSLPEVKPFESVVRIAKTKEEFLACVEEELQTNSDEKVKMRVKIAGENTWENRVNEMERIIESELRRWPG